MNVLRISLAAVYISLLLASCNNSGTTTNTETQAILPKSDTIIISEMKYTPDNITINKGDTLVFINNDIVSHDVTEENKAWTSSELKVGDAWKTVPEKSANYYCSIHVVMKGAFTVK